METQMEQEYMKGGEFLIADDGRPRFYTRGSHRRAADDRRDDARVCRQRGAAAICRRWKTTHGRSPAIWSKRRRAWPARCDHSRGIRRARPRPDDGRRDRRDDGPRAAASARRSAHRPRSALLPILYFGSEELKQKWIPKIVSGEVVTAYCLTESGSGSDALGAKTTAKLTEDGQTLHAERREDVHLERQLCRRVISSLQRSTARRRNSRPSSSNAAKTAGPAARSTRWASSRRRPRRSSCRMQRFRRRTSSATSATVQRSRSIS